MQPAATFWGAMGLLFVYPWAAILGKDYMEFVDLLGNKSGNTIQFLISRVEELNKEKEKKKIDDKKEKKGFLYKVKSFFKRNKN
jgi:hypothetical protein